jgi:hypothetical protein
MEFARLARENRTVSRQSVGGWRAYGIRDEVGLWTVAGHGAVPLTSPGYDAAFRACLKLAMVGGGSAARYRAMALKGLAQAECMRAHGITGYPSPGALDGDLHEPDATAIGLDTHTPQFAAAARACGMVGELWQAQWWWPAGLSQP